MTSNNLSASIVIRCYNEELHIGRLLDGITKQTVRDVEIIVVDSGSTDNTVSIASRYPIKLLAIKPEDFSFGRSLNIGCRAATKDVIVIASAHVYPTYDDWLERMLTPFADSQVALVYGRQRGNEITKYSEHQVMAKWFGEATNLDQEEPFCNNANAAIRRHLFDLLEYDESLTGLEDLDWAHRAMTLGHKIAYVAEAEIIHAHNESSKQTYNRYRREAIALSRIFTNERFGGQDFCRLFLANVINDYRHAVLDRSILRHIAEIPCFRFMQFWGTYRGFAQRGPVTSQLKKTFYYPVSRQSKKNVTDTDLRQRPVQYIEEGMEQTVESNNR